MLDVLRIGYEKTEKDMPCLEVFRTKNDKIEIVNCVMGERATELYNLLIRGNKDVDSGNTR